MGVPEVASISMGLESPVASAVVGWIARIKRDFGRVDEAFNNAGMLQLLVNPRFQVWQRQDRLGVTSWSAYGDCTADRWQLSFEGAATMVVTRVSSPYELRAVYTHAASMHGTVSQRLECWPQLLGRTVSLRVRAKTSTPSAIRAFIADGVGTTFGSYHAGDGVPAWLDVTRTMDASATICLVGLWFEASCTADLSGAALVHGSTPLLCLPLDPQQERARCERYFEVHGGASGWWPYLSGYMATAGGNVGSVSVPFRALKGGVPTVTLAGTWSVNNATQPTVAGATAEAYLLQTASSAAGYFAVAPNSADDLIIAEWNP